VELVIRDGRTNRKIAADGKGEVLARLDHPTFLDIGDEIALPDGTRVPVIGIEETAKTAGITQTVFIGDPVDER
jgi:urease accessory protein UreE